VSSQKATVDTTVLIIKSGKPKKRHKVTVVAPVRPVDISVSASHRISQERFAENEGYVIDYRLDDVGARLAERLAEKYEPIEVGFEFGVGINTGYIREDLVASERLDDRYHAMVTGRGMLYNWLYATRF
jgi:adenine-specific DNA-methyltransferase